MNNINGKTRVIGVIGNPIEHTMSPFIHNRLAELMSINSTYVPFHVQSDQVEASVAGANALNILGYNVTIPYKVEVMPYLDVISENACMIGAVNTVKHVKGQSFGYNTDAEGLKISCLKQGILFDQSTVCILGAGGAAKSVAILCAQMKVGKLIIVNRTYDKAVELKNTLAKYYDLHVEVLTYEALPFLQEIDICFQTTSSGMYPHIDFSPILDPQFFTKVKWAVDIIYNPSETKFLREAREKGCHTLNGSGMLFFQAVKAFEIWHDLIIPDSILEVSYGEFLQFVYSKK